MTVWEHQRPTLPVSHPMENVALRYITSSLGNGGLIEPRERCFQCYYASYSLISFPTGMIIFSQQVKFFITCVPTFVLLVQRHGGGGERGRKWANLHEEAPREEDNTSAQQTTAAEFKSCTRDSSWETDSPLFFSAALFGL